MSLRARRLWIGAVCTAALLWFGVVDVGRTSPGELSAVHAREGALSGWRSCARCHGGWTTDMGQVCLECHEPIGAQISGGRGLHGSAPAQPADRCGRCHGEHHGAEFAMVNRQSFAKAGVPDPAAFDHAHIGFAMDGRHLELACSECHRNADDAILPPGARRYLGLQQDCSSCHRDAHEGRMRIACASCHGQRSFTSLTSLDHDAHLPLTGAHADVSCRDCHAPDNAHSLEALGERRAPRARGCANCHASPHRPGFLAAAGELAGSAPDASCTSCHRPEHATFTDERLAAGKAWHACSGFGLDAPHDRAACSDCHGDGGDFAARHPGRRADDCRVCHGDPHQGQFDAGPFAAAGCIGCHARSEFTPHRFGIEQHARTVMPLIGRHAEAACERCHLLPETGSPRRFAGTPQRCDQCHRDAHAGFFDARARAAELPAAGKCALCHEAHAFAQSDSFEHERWTGFALRGAHAQERCESCHARAGEPDAAGRTFGRAAGNDCAQCHADPHAGRFARGGRTDCAQCHAETSFRTVQRFDHGRWTGFALQGAHAKAACTACHTPAPESRSLQRARGARCADCHADPHAGQFAVAGAVDCARCHRDGEQFTELAFNHEIQSRFPLGEAHGALPCAACHLPESIAGAPVVRYRPIAHACADCHGTQDDPLRRARGRRR
jgi:hypothetical protein